MRLGVTCAYIACLIVVKQVQQDAKIAFFIRNGFTLHDSGDNLTHHQ